MVSGPDVAAGLPANCGLVLRCVSRSAETTQSGHGFTHRNRARRPRTSGIVGRVGLALP
jgi:hypothetical protein